MKLKTAIFGLLAVAICIGGAMWANYIFSTQPVTVTIPASTTIEIKTTANKLVYSAQPSETTVHSFRVQTGDYQAILKSDDLGEQTLRFTVTSSTKDITLTPSFSPERLKSLLEREQSAITAVINTAIIQGKRRIVSGGTLLGSGDWYGATVVPQPATSHDSADVYRFLLVKKNGVWSAPHAPTLALSQADYPDVPSVILDTVNSMAADYSAIYDTES